MIIKGVVAERFQDYKKPSLFICTSRCDFKCCRDGNFPTALCQNNHLVNQDNIDYKPSDLLSAYQKNPITQAIVFGGLEPMLQFIELYEMIAFVRNNGCDDDIVIYTGYNRDEIAAYVNALASFKNIIIKFGRYVPNQSQHFDPVLGVNLASDNQYAEVIS